MVSRAYSRLLPLAARAAPWRAYGQSYDGATMRILCAYYAHGRDPTSQHGTRPVEQVLRYFQHAPAARAAPWPPSVDPARTRRPRPGQTASPSGLTGERPRDGPRAWPRQPSGGENLRLATRRPVHGPAHPLRRGARRPNRGGDKLGPKADAESGRRRRQRRGRGGGGGLSWRREAGAPRGQPPPRRLTPRLGAGPSPGASVADEAPGGPARGRALLRAVGTPAGLASRGWLERYGP